MGVQIPARAIADAQAGAGELWQVVLAIAGPESGWDPRAVGDAGCSLGYLQMNRCGGLGVGHSEAELFDGVSNFRLGAEYIRGRLAGGATLWDALQPWSARPAAWALLGRIQTEGIDGIGGASAPSSPGSIPATATEDAVTIAALAVLALLIVGG